MTSRHLAVDFGSTYTKAVLFDLDAGCVLGIGYAPSTVDQDVRHGLVTALQALGNPEAEKAPCLACSSAAGGLRIAAVGLVPTLSLEAARRAALGAGAKVVGAYGYKLGIDDLDEIAALDPDILLLAGGTDGGDEETILHNAERLAKLDLEAPVIVAGNKAVASDCADLLRESGLTSIVVPNILPEIDRLEVEAVHDKIREIFMERIIHGKGIDRVGDEVDLAGPIIPTPRAILEAARLISEGGAGEPGVGDVVVVDIGGATTDVHSVASGAPRTPGVIQRGLPELHAKRTVEGDLGMRISASGVLSRLGAAVLSERSASVGGEAADEDAIIRYVERMKGETSYVPTEPAELAIDAALGCAAAQIAMTRHAGRIKEVYTASGPALVQEGKDLTGTQLLIGVGGVLAHGPYGSAILKTACQSLDDPSSLLPQKPRMVVDRCYVLFGVGLLAERYPEAALRVAGSQLEPL